MEAFEIDEENIGLFLPLLGEDLTDDLKRVYYRGIGVRDEGEKPVGAVVYELIGSESGEDTTSRICLARYKNEETGSLLQQYYTEKSVGEEEIAVSTYELPREEETEVFRKAGFTGEERESDEIRVTLGNLAGLDLAKNRKLPDYIGSIADLSVLQYRDAIKKILFKGQKGILEDLAYLPKNWFDEQVSACSLSDDKVDGLFLVRRTPSGMLIPVLLYAYGPDYRKNLLYMMSHALLEALQLYPAGTSVAIHRRSEATRALVSKLLPNINGEDVYYGMRKEENAWM